MARHGAAAGVADMQAVHTLGRAIISADLQTAILMMLSHLQSTSGGCMLIAALCAGIVGP